MIVSFPRRIAEDSQVPGLLVMLENVFKNSRKISHRSNGQSVNSTLEKNCSRTTSNNFVIFLNFTKIYFHLDHVRKTCVTAYPNMVTESQKYTMYSTCGIICVALLVLTFVAVKCRSRTVLSSVLVFKCTMVKNPKLLVYWTFFPAISK